MAKKLTFKTEKNVPAGTGKFKEKIWKLIIFFASLTSLKKGVGSNVKTRSGSEILVRGTSTCPDPDPHQNVTDPQRWFLEKVSRGCLLLVIFTEQLPSTPDAGLFLLLIFWYYKIHGDIFRSFVRYLSAVPTKPEQCCQFFPTMFRQWVRKIWLHQKNNSPYKFLWNCKLLNNDKNAN